MSKLTEAQIEQRRKARTNHGGYSAHQIKPIAQAVKRRFLRQNGLKIGDLSGVQLAYLDTYARCMAKVQLIDVHVGARGERMLSNGGEPDPAMKLYVSLFNSARLSMAKLEESLQISSGGVSGGKVEIALRFDPSPQVESDPEPTEPIPLRVVAGGADSSEEVHPGRAHSHPGEPPREDVSEALPSEVIAVGATRVVPASAPCVRPEAPPDLAWGRPQRSIADRIV
jgi:hypothetical protein